MIKRVEWADQVKALAIILMVFCHAGCTHGILSGNAIKRIEESPIEELVITNTVPLDEKNKIEKIKVISIAPLFANAIKNIHENKPLGELLKI